MQRQVSLTPIEPRGHDELEAVQAQIVLDEQREDEQAQHAEKEEDQRIQMEMELEEDEKDRVQEGGRNPKISADMIRYDFSTGRRPRRFATRGDVAYRPDEAGNKQYLRVFAPCVMFLEVRFAVSVHLCLLLNLLLCLCGGTGAFPRQLRWYSTQPIHCHDGSHVRAAPRHCGAVFHRQAQ